MLETEFRIKPFAWLKRSWAAPVLVVIGFFIWFWLFCLPWSTYEIDWPAWVQTVGSVGAILVAIWISERGHARAVEREGRIELAENVRLYWVADTAANELDRSLSLLRDMVGAQFVFDSTDPVYQQALHATDTLKHLLQQRLPYPLINHLFEAVSIASSTLLVVDSWHGKAPIAKPEWAASFRFGVVEQNRQRLKICRTRIYTEYSELAKSAGVKLPQRAIQ